MSARLISKPGISVLAMLTPSVLRFGWPRHCVNRARVTGSLNTWLFQGVLRLADVEFHRADLRGTCTDHQGQQGFSGNGLRFIF